jgi:hypothetical protein
VTRTTRIIAVALSALVLVAVAAGSAFGFSDDSGVSSTFVSAATALNKAGCASGFGDGSFGYNGNVTRGQDAIFQMACASGAAFVNNIGANPATVTLTANPQPLSTLSFTAGLNPGGLQYVLVHGVGVLENAVGATVTPSLTLTPPAGGNPAQPASITCLKTSHGNGVASEFSCDGGFIVPTGQQFSITFAAAGAGTASRGTLSAWSAPRGNSVTSGSLA